MLVVRESYVQKGKGGVFFEGKHKPCEAMIHPDTLLLRRVVLWGKQKSRGNARGRTTVVFVANRGNMGETLGAEPKLFYP